MTTHWHSFPDTMQRPAEVWFDLPASPARAVSLRNYLERDCLCLLFLSGTSPREVALLEALSRAHDSFRDNDAETLVVMHLSVSGVGRLAEDMALSFPLLSDGDGATRARYASLLPLVPDVETPLVYVMDRYGAPRAAAVLPPAGDEEWLSQALEWVQLAELACPE